MNVVRGPNEGSWWGSTGTSGEQTVFITLEPSGTPTGWRILSFSVRR